MAARERAAGFVLVSVLLALAVLALLAAYINEVVATDVGRAVEEKQSFQRELTRYNIEATLVYILSTGRMNHHAVLLEEHQRFSDPQSGSVASPFSASEKIDVSGTVYAGPGSIRFSIRDEGGLLSVNAPEFSLFATVLERIGVAEDDIARIVARVEDYIDSDDAPAPEGAESPQYRRQGKGEPLNWIMASPLEIGEVLGIRDLLTPEQLSHLLPLLTVRPVSVYNFNTMHPQILSALLGSDTDGLRDLLDERKENPLSRSAQLAMLSGRHLDIDGVEVAVIPSGFMRLEIWNAPGGPRSVVGIELTPFGESAPWRKDYRYSRPAASRNDPGTPSDPPLQAETPLLR